LRPLALISELWISESRVVIPERSEIVEKLLKKKQGMVEENEKP
jgi:hypothetical protein